MIWLVFLIRIIRLFRFVLKSYDFIFGGCLSLVMKVGGWDFDVNSLGAVV